MVWLSLDNLDYTTDFVIHSNASDLCLFPGILYSKTLLAKVGLNPMHGFNNFM